MRLPNTIQRQCLRHAEAVMARRGPDFVIGDNYLQRWWLIPKNPVFNVYLHAFHASDDDRALHDHPWASLSVLLKGEYREHVPANPADPAGPTRTINRSEGTLIFRRPRAAHRVELSQTPQAEPVITLFITGFKIRKWGFWCKSGWRHWKEFVDPDNPGQRGPGCE